MELKGKEFMKKIQGVRTKDSKMKMEQQGRKAPPSQATRRDIKE